jgi:hypothetical protein
MSENTKEIQIPAQELITLLSSVQLASSRGSFRPEEFVEIGTAYQKLYNFLVDLNVLVAPNKDGQKSEDNK